MSPETNRRVRLLGPAPGHGVDRAAGAPQNRAAGAPQNRAAGASPDSTSFLLVDVETNEPHAVPAGDLPESALPGHLLEGTLVRGGDDAHELREPRIVERTLLEFVDAVGNLFEAALDTWAEARAEGLAVNSRVTYDTGRNPVGALYTFAEQSGDRDVFRDLRDGTLPLEPLLERAAESSPSPHEVFVLRPAAHDFVLVYVVLEAGSVLADTVRDTYDCPRPPHTDWAFATE